MASLDFARHRTRSPSPGRMFAASINPIVIDSSPYVPFTSSNGTSNLAGSTACRSTRRIGRESHGGSKERVTEKPCALAISPGRENLPLQCPQKQKGVKEDDTLPSINDVREKSLFKGSPNRLVRPSLAKPEPKRSKPKAGGTRRTKKSDGLVNGTITGRATKASATRSSKSTKEALKEPSNSQSEEIPVSFKEPRSIGAEWEIETLHLEAATKRRNDWTPVKDTAVSSIDLTANLDTSPASMIGNGGQRFSTLLSDFAFTKDPVSTSDTGYREQAPTKKRRLEFYQGTTNSVSLEASSSESLEKSRSQQNGAKGKRPRRATATTITSLSTAQYGQRATSPSSSLLEFFSPGKAVTKKTGGRAAGTNSRAKKDGTRKTKEVPAPRVIPAIDAIKSLEDQVYLFGTSSQLERISSDEDSQVTKSNIKTRPSLQPKENPQSLLSRFQASRNLWFAGCRDLDGSVADIEVVDMIDSNAPKTVDHLVISRPMTSASNSAPEPAEWRASESIRDSQTIPATQKTRSLPPETEATAPVKEMPNFRGFTTAELTQKVAAFGFKTVKNREKMITLLENCWESQSKAPVSTSLPANSSKARATAAGKQEKGGREILRKQPACEPKSKSKAHPGAKSLPSSKGSKPVPNQPVCSQHNARPGDGSVIQKATQSSSQSIVVIPDSDEDDDEDFFSTAPEHPTQTSTAYSLGHATNFNPPETPLSIRTRDNIEAEIMETPDIKQQITKAIRAQPRLTAINGVKCPTWHEKILMYDPIRLDDLTVWLNTEGLNGIEEDREVNRLTVREWCESKGICCTWTK